MIILAFDCATKTGFSVWADGQLMESGVVDFSKRRGETNGVMFLRFRKWLRTLTAKWKPDVMVHEGAHHRGGAATEICVNLTGRVAEESAWLSSADRPKPKECELYWIGTRELKSFAAGSGNASKADMIAACKRLTDCNPVDDNEADAVLLGLYAVERLDCEAVRDAS